MNLRAAGKAGPWEYKKADLWAAKMERAPVVLTAAWRVGRTELRMEPRTAVERVAWRAAWRVFSLADVSADPLADEMAAWMVGPSAPKLDIEWVIYWVALTANISAA